MCEMSTCQVDYQSRVSYTCGRAWETRGASLGLCGHADIRQRYSMFHAPISRPTGWPGNAGRVVGCELSWLSLRFALGSISGRFAASLLSSRPACRTISLRAGVHRNTNGDVLRR